MPLNPFIKPLSLTIKPSLQKWFLIVIPHLLAILLILNIGVFPLWSKFILALFVTASFAYYFQSHLALKLKKSVISFQQDSVENWFITLSGSDNNIEPKSVSLLPSSFISKLFIVLNFQDNSGSHYNVILMTDSISNNEFRYLYIRLKSTYIKLN